MQTNDFAKAVKILKEYSSFPNTSAQLYRTLSEHPMSSEDVIDELSTLNELYQGLNSSEKLDEELKSLLLSIGLDVSQNIDPLLYANQIYQNNFIYIVCLALASDELRRQILSSIDGFLEHANSPELQQQMSSSEVRNILAKKSLFEDLIKASLKLGADLLHSEFLGIVKIDRNYTSRRFFSGIREIGFQTRQRHFDHKYSLTKAYEIIAEMERYKLLVPQVLCSLVITLPEMRKRAEECYSSLTKEQTLFDEMCMNYLLSDSRSASRFLDNHDAFRVSFKKEDLIADIFKLENTYVNRMIDITKEDLDRILVELRNNNSQGKFLEDFGNSARSEIIENLIEIAEKKFPNRIEEIKSFKNTVQQSYGQMLQNPQEDQITIKKM